jgi:hypothetical protein
MNREHASIEWYTGVSATKKLAPRCPFALVDRCPKYYESAAVLAEVGLTAPLPPADTARLDQKWNGWMSPIPEQSASVFSADDSVRGIWNICPEIGFEIFGYFATLLHKYADEIDLDFAHRRLSAEVRAGAIRGGSGPVYYLSIILNAACTRFCLPL